MLESKTEGGAWTLSLDGRTLVSHTIASPFAEAVLREPGEAQRRFPLALATEDGPAAVVLSGAEDHALRVEFEPCRGGAILRFRGEAGMGYALRLPAEPGEAVFGGGAQGEALNRRGGTTVHLAGDGPAPRPGGGAGKGPADGGCAPMPVYVTDRGRLIAFETAAAGDAAFGPAAYRFRFDACPERLALLAGADYAALAGLLTRLIPNGQYLPAWCHDGVLVELGGGAAAVTAAADRLLDAGVRLAGVLCRDWSGARRGVLGPRPCRRWTADEGLYPDLGGLIAGLRSRGVRFLAAAEPVVDEDSPLYARCAARGWLVRRADGAPYRRKRGPEPAAGLLDLTNPEANRFIRERLRALTALGAAGWLAGTAALPADGVLHSGDPARLRNQWPVRWAMLNREAAEAAGDGVFFLARGGYLGVQGYAPILWDAGGVSGFSLGFSGVTLTHSGAERSLAERLRPDRAAYVRRLERQALSPLMLAELPPAGDDGEALAQLARLSGLHAALKPYLLHLCAQAGRGLPAERPDFWEAGSYAAARDPRAYFLGDDLFVCPVTDRDDRIRRVWLPAGDWVHLWSNKPFDGGRRYTLPAALGYPPVFYRPDSPFAGVFRAAAGTARAPL